MSTARSTTPWLAELRALLGPGGYLDQPDELEPFLGDWRHLYRGSTPMVALPATTAEVAGVVRVCAEHRVPIVPHGGNTSYCGGATPRESGVELVLGLRRLNRIRELDVDNYSVTAEAGCVLARLQAASEEAGRYFPMSLGSEGSCTIGGNLSTNAGGTAVLRYGMMRDLVLGLEVVLPDGRVLDQLRSLRKDNTGYDLKQLFIGAEGSLGVITAACLKLFPRPAAYATAIASLRSVADAVTLLGRLRDAVGDAVVTFELIPAGAMELVARHVEAVQLPFEAAPPCSVLMELALPAPDSDLATRLEALLEQALLSGLLTDAVIADSLARRDNLWKLRESIPEAQTREGASLKHDISLPTSALPGFMTDAAPLVDSIIPGARLIAYGHLGDGNLHFNVSPPIGMEAAAFLERGPALKRAVHDLVASRGGSFSAEHGIGRLKVGELERYENPVALSLMRQLKQSLDPLGIMNPGKVLA
ncbi:MAG: FAD-binding oxidoreductase [Steroidobacteraceae bacterium]